MSISLKQYTMRYLVVAILLIITIWASLFYAFILDEVYDNVDDGLRNQKILILREAYEDPSILQTTEYGVNQFKITPTTESSYNERNTFSNKMFYMPYDDEDEPYRVLSTGFYGPDKMPYNLDIRTSTVEQDDLIIDLSIALAILYVVMIGSIFLLNEYVLTRAWKPFKTILNSLAQYQVGKAKKLDMIQSDVVEFNDLHDHIDEMVQRNEAVFNDQKLFIENASHELQTPLAITISKLDMLMDDETLSENTLTQLADTKKSLRRLIDLNKSLLLLSRVENRQFVQDEEVNLNEITRELVDLLEDIATHKGLDLQLVESGVFSLKGNRDLLSTALSNLLRNALRYTEKGGHVIIDIKPGVWTIKNSSTQGALPDAHIFNRFYKGSDSLQSNGLGLSIVHSIIHYSVGIDMKYSFENKFHVFSIFLSDS